MSATRAPSQYKQEKGDKLPKIGFKAPSKSGIEATGTGITVVIAKIRQILQRRKAS